MAIYLDESGIQMGRDNKYEDIPMSTFSINGEPVGSRKATKKGSDKHTRLTSQQLKQWLKQQPNLGQIVPFVGRFTDETGAEQFIELKQVLLFPGNDGHAEDQLYTQTPGANLAKVAYQFSQQGVPTLSLPTTFFNPLNHSAEATRKLAIQEIAKLWRALGAGYSFVLPVRKVKPQNPIFDETDKQLLKKVSVIPSELDGKPVNYEPSLWGGVSSKTQNYTKQLPSYYSKSLWLLQCFSISWNSLETSDDKIKLIKKLNTLDGYDGKVFARSFLKGLLFTHSPDRLSRKEKHWFSQPKENNIKENFKC